MFENGVDGDGCGARRCLHGVAVTVWPAQESLVDTREFLRAVIEPGLAHVPGCEFDGPAVQRGPALAGSVDAVEDLGMPHHVQDDRAGLLVCVERVKDIAGRYVEPPDVVSTTVPRQNSDSSRVGGIPRVGHVRVPAGAFPEHGRDRIRNPDATDERGEHQPYRCSQCAWEYDFGALDRIKSDW